MGGAPEVSQGGRCALFIDGLEPEPFVYVCVYVVAAREDYGAPVFTVRVSQA